MRIRDVLIAAGILVLCRSSGFAAEPQAETQPGSQPRIVREPIEWLDMWIPDSTVDKLPRVLLIGDSIVKGYYGEVQERLKGKAYVARLATSKFVADPAYLGEVSLILSENHFDVIHFNNGMHGWDYTEEEYRRGFPALLALLKKESHGAKLIWAATTPVRQGPKAQEFSPRTERVRERNKIAAEFVAKENIPVDDLFSLVEKHAEFFSGDGVHFAGPGVTAEAAQVSASILRELKQ
jgi:lysophospholipase L1-like esterase